MFNLVTNSLDIIYIAIQNISIFSFSENVFIFSNFIHEYNFFFFYELIFRASIYFLNYELFVFNILDIFFKNISYFFEFNETTFRSCIGALDLSLNTLYHPEFLFIDNSLKFFLINEYSSFFKLIVIDFIQKNEYVTAVNLMIQVFILFYFILFFIIFFFSFFSKNKEEWQQDCDYTISNASVESEKELFSIDDALNVVFFLILIFGSYFGFLFLSLSFNFTEIAIFILPIFFVFYLIIFIPFNLLFDFGLFFIAYLRGSSNTSSLFFECVYDYIGVIAFFTRLIVQFVRLILMFVVYCLMHDTVMLQVFSQKNFLLNDSFFEDLNSIQSNGYSISFFLFTTFPMRLMYWTYECMHTFFVVTVQFSAFFTIVFWLFLLFYTFFVFEKHELHFNNLNRIHNILRSELISIKK